MNRLADALSPYLRQHAGNPVSWQPWDARALSEARERDVPILLSIGYSACHWCHVMERESFEDAAIATQMNAGFVCIKVDREERPDLDRAYQLAHQAITRRAGGWPLTVFLTPSLHPFYAGTYFPPEDRHGMPGFPAILRAVASAYRDRRAEVDSMGQELVAALANLSKAPPAPDALSLPEAFLARAGDRLLLRFDTSHGGFGGAPKFPSTTSLDLLLLAHGTHGAPQHLDAVTRTLDAMRDGGIHDQLGGGFHRYSTDSRWLVPHFEKMLYDNALLLRTYADAYRLTRDESHADVIRGIASYLEREMRDASGLFYATQDADSEGEEGRFFVWTEDELVDVLGEDDGRAAALWFGVAEGGNFEHGRSVLHRARRLETWASQLGASPAAATQRLESIQRRLFEARERRPKPFRDEKAIAAWNGLVVSGLAEAGMALSDDALIALARGALAGIEDLLFDGERLRRLAKDGRAVGRGFLEDYAFVMLGALDVYEATGDAGALAFAHRLARIVVARFRTDDGAFRFAEPTEDLAIAPWDPYDDATPSAFGAVAVALLRLDDFGAEEGLREIVERAIAPHAAEAMEMPFGHATLLQALSRWSEGPTQIVVVGPSDEPSTRALLCAVRERYVPRRTLLHAETAGALPASVADLVAGASPAGATAFVCRDRTCSPPAADADALGALLAR